MPNTIAVLPFVNMSSDPENEYFCDGITEEIINALASIEGLRVTSRTSSFYFKGKNISLTEIAEQLSVSVILEGSIRLAGKMVRITAQLIQAEEDFHFWSETWDRQLDNIFEIQDEISLLIADKLREQFGHFEIQEHLVSPPTKNLDAYDYFLKAKYLFNNWNPEDVGKSIELYEKAIALDPLHTEAFAGLADAYSFMATTEFMSPAEAWPKANEYIQKANELNPDHPEVHYQLGQFAFFLESDFHEAVRHTAKAIELKPNFPKAHQFMSLWYTISGDLDRAQQHLQKALTIDPLSKETLFFKAYFHYRIKEFEEAMRLLEPCFVDNPNNLPAYVVKCNCLLKMGRYDEALAFMEQISEAFMVPGDRLGITCLAYIMKGDTAKAETYFKQVYQDAQDPMAIQAHFYLFLAYANKGETDAAFQWLEKTRAFKSPILLLNFTDPLVADLPDDPRYDNYRELFFGETQIKEKKNKEKQTLLDKPTADQYLNRLMEYVEAEEPFLDPSLSLRSLANRIQIHPNQLSWLINNRMEKNFNEFINHFRVEYFKELAVDPKNAHISLIGLAYESGFNSKTVFNTYFKKEVGMTPRAYLSSQS